jgi:tetratricopeptide (TPR) repeat protein
VPEQAPAFVQAVPRFARALGNAHLGKPDAARAEVAALARLADTLRANGDAYWATVVTAQRLAADAWVARAEGRNDDARRLAREAAELEETVEKHPVTPGPLLPARELEGELLLALGEPAAAQASFERTLAREPGRARALYGAARSAELGGRPDAARKHYTALVELMEKADASRAEAGAAKKFLAVK